jgi:hypothetical protein
VSKPPPKKHIQRGLILTEGIEGIKHWIRLFSLEEELAFGIERFNEICADPAHIAQGAGAKSKLLMPIVNEYRVYEDLSYVYLLSIQIDTIGLVGGSGIIYVCEDSNKADAMEHRDKYADFVMKELVKNDIWKEAYVKPSGKEPNI